MDFNEFWTAYKPNEIRFPRRRAATFLAWNERTPAARKAMLAEVKANGAPEWKNPYFFVQDFPEPKPHNYNGDPRIDDLLRAQQVAPAEFNGKFGMYSLEDIELFHLRRPPE